MKSLSNKEKLEKRISNAELLYQSKCEAQRRNPSHWNYEQTIVAWKKLTKLNKKLIELLKTL